MKFTGRTMLLASAALAFWDVSSAAIAQEADATIAAQPAQQTDENERTRTLSAVTVTARRREESLQTVPVTVTAFTAEDLAEQGIADIQRLANNTPGVTIDSFPRLAPRATFRGIGGQNQGAGADPSAVAFLDGINLGRGPMLAVDMFDVARVEVLKGPQGTLWGRNVIGGAVNYVTEKPIDEPLTKLRATFGDYGQKNLFAVVNRPLTDSIDGRIALSSVKNNGFRTNLNTGGPLDDEERISGRASVMFNFANDSDLLISVDRTEDDTAGGSRFNLTPFNYEDVDNPRGANPDRPGFIRRETGGARIEYNAPLFSFADFTALIGYRDLSFSSSEDFDGTTPAGNAMNGIPVPAIQVLMEEESEAYSGEFRLTSSTDSAFSWVTGLYLLKEETHRERESETAVVDTSLNRFIGDNTTEHAALFGEVSYEFLPRAHVFVGGRFTNEQKEYEITHLVGDESAPVIDYSTVGSPGTTDENKFTWRVGADYQLTDQVFAYGSVSTGFKSGAFQEQAPAATAQLATEPEEATNYELGLKSTWLDGQLILNGAVFFLDYSNLQQISTVPDLTGPVGTTAVVIDTADAEIKGLELESNLVLDNGLGLDLSYAYLDAIYGSFVETTQINADGSRSVNDSSGNMLQTTPEHKIVFGVSYETPQYDWGYLNFRIGGNYESEVFEDSTNTFIEYREGRTLMDAVISYVPSDNLSVRFWVNNLTDETTRTHQAETAGGLFAQYAPPRQAGVTIDMTF